MNHFALQILLLKIWIKILPACYNIFWNIWAKNQNINFFFWHKTAHVSVCSVICIIKDQYMLIHDALAEYLLCPLTEIRQSDVKLYTDKLSETPPDIMPSLLQNIFLVSASCFLVGWILFQRDWGGDGENVFYVFWIA